LTRRSLSEGGSEDGARRQDRIVYASLIAVMAPVIVSLLVAFH
jgi:hypothetical protein